MFIGFREREEYSHKREMLIAHLPHVPRQGIKPEQVCALTRNWTRKLLVYGMMLQPTERPSQGSLYSLEKYSW